MGKLIYLITTSLDGYVFDKAGNFDWAQPSEEVHAFINEVMRNTGTFFFGRKMFETMKVWDDIPTKVIHGSENGDSEAMANFAGIWRNSDKVVYSTTLDEVTTQNTTIERSFNPEIIARSVTDSEKDFGIGGPNLAAQAMKANMIDEYHLITIPVLIGDGISWFQKGVTTELSLVGSRSFDNGPVYLHYKKKA